MHVYLAPLVALVGLFIYLVAGSGTPPRVPAKLSTVGIVMLAAGLLATLLRLDASSFRLH